MSEVEQKETEYVAGTIEGITQKGPDKWQVGVKPDGSQYAKNLWTKDSELVAALAQKIGQAGGFTCSVSHWTNQEGKPVRSLWIESQGAIVHQPPAASPSESAVASGGLIGPVAEPRYEKPVTEGMTPEKWDAKERRDYRSRAWAQTLGAFQHTIKVDEKPEDVFARLQPFQRKVFTDVCGMFSFPADESDTPF